MARSEKRKMNGYERVLRLRMTPTFATYHFITSLIIDSEFGLYFCSNNSIFRVFGLK